VAREVFEYEDNHTIWQDNGAQCRCRKFFSNGMVNESHLVRGHICTADFTIINNKRLKYLFAMGSKFREEITEQTLKDGFRIGVVEFKEKVRRDALRNGKVVNEDNLELWATRVIQAFNRKYDLQETKLPTNSSRAQDQKALKDMQKIFVISQCDKLSHNLAMTCKHLYLTDLRNEILNNQTYKKLDHQDILQWGLQEIGVPLDDPSYFYRAGLIKHQIFNEAKNLQHVNNMFYLYAIQKIHKQKQRYVAGVGKPLMAIPYNEGAFIQQIILGGNGEDTDSDNGSGSERSAVVEDDNSTVDLEDERLRRDRDIIGQRHSAKIHRPKCSTTEASKELSKQLTMIIELLQEKDSLNEEYKRCFITRKAEEVFTMIKNNQQVFDKLQPRTFDFTTLYTKLPLQQIVENMQIAIDEAMEYKNGLGNGAAITAKYIELKSAAELMEYVNFIDIIHLLQIV